MPEPYKKFNMSEEEWLNSDISEGAGVGIHTAKKLKEQDINTIRDLLTTEVIDFKKFDKGMYRRLRATNKKILNNWKK